MTYATFTTWELDDGCDWHVFMDNMRDRRIPALREMGASRVTVMRTSDRTFAALAEWPDKLTRDTALHAIHLLREKVHTDGSRMTGEFEGKVMAEVSG